MGLTIVKQIVESAGGKVTVDSSGVNQGSTFTVEIKMKATDLQLGEENEGSSLPLVN